MTNEEILSIFKSTGALLEGHFKLSSGLHSAQYFQCAKVLQYPEYNEALCKIIVEKFSNHKIDVVAAPALGGIVVAQEIGRQLNARTIFAERTEGNMQFRRGFQIFEGENVLVCEDVITTGGSIVEVIELVKSMKGNVAGAASIVDRSGGKVKLDAPFQFSILTLEIENYQPENCPLCKENIPLVKPGSRVTSTEDRNVRK
ncbi:MAG: Orotate phosphoribosyltransferase [Ignavibacteriae bacterium]|nr:MAG: Orotate phosphoribosyltransferase [Ignavibacteriota bacterium]